MTGGRQHVQMETFAFGVRLSLDGIVKVVKDLDGDAVCIFVIVTEERGTVQYELSHGFLSFEVGIGSMADLLRIEFTFFEYMFFQNGEAVGNSTQTGALNIACVITRIFCGGGSIFTLLGIVTLPKELYYN